MKFAIFSNVQQKRNPEFGTHVRPTDRDTLANEGTVAPEELPPGERLRYLVREAELADELGYDFFFTGEHHFSRGFSCVPTQATATTLLVQATKRIRVGPMVVILPINEPLRVAEDTVLLDHLSGGRLVVGLGKGVVPHEVIAYGVDARESHRRTMEGIEFLLKAWTSDDKFSFLGEFSKYFEVEMPWKPVQQPHPAVWYPTQTPATAAQMASRGFSVGVFSWHGLAENQPVIDAYRAARDAYDGDSSDMHMGMLSSVVVADTDSEAEELARANFELQIALFEFEIKRSKRYVVEQRERDFMDHLVEVFRDMVTNFKNSSDEFMIIHGSPRTVVGKLRDLERLGVDTLVGEFDFGFVPIETVLKSMTLFGTEVIPVLRDAGSR
jgi:alkanesulfonate monooxygenase SsuD/methylene tetrahydromethanopterin reductase-like flavin-dependent oxidoreductase (luciferase family)